ncbi:MAG: response regulator transcription factor [Dehalococcoidia bacterium]|nr:response regulator transcription factor [Dehalococcoidia bacterium]
MPEKMKVLVTGEHGLLREGLHRLLGAYEDIDVVGEAEDGKEAVEKACALQPDIVIIDSNLKIMNGMEVTRRLAREAPKIKVIILTDRDTRENVVGAFVAGACGCVPMTTTGADLASAVRAVHKGEIYLHHSLSRTMVNTYLSFRKIEETDDPYEQLTEREKHVLRLVAEGQTSRQIAYELGIAMKTVRRHTAGAMKKLSIHNRSELIKYAIRKGIIQLEIEA